jgi:hypothetical protein
MHRTFLMTHRTKIIAGALALACFTLTGCVSEGGGYSRGGPVGYNPVYERSHDGPDRYWRNRRDRDRDHDRGSRNDRNDRNDRGRSSYNRAADARDKPNPTWANHNISRDRDRDRNNRPDRNRDGRPGGDNIIIRNR